MTNTVNNRDIISQRHKETFNRLYSPHAGSWYDWRWQLKNRITTLEEIESLIELTPEEKKGIVWSKGKLAMAITPYFFSLIDPDDPNCPVRRQVIPTIEESVIVNEDMGDPCGEDSHAPVKGLVHRYPDRALLIVTETCASYCRYCTRKRIVSREAAFNGKDHPKKALDYIRSHKEIRDVLVSGGDPFILETGRLEGILSQLRAIDHVEILRIGTKIPVTMPQRIDTELTDMLRRFHPLFVSIHLTHPKELTGECRNALGLLADAGIPLGSQTVLLNGINDNPETMKELMHGLLKSRVRPYYLYQADLVPGTAHFRTSVDTGIAIIESLRGHTTGYAVPSFVIDAPGGGGKVPVGPYYIKEIKNRKIKLRNYNNMIFEYTEPEVKKK